MQNLILLFSTIQYIGMLCSNLTKNVENIGFLLIFDLANKILIDGLHNDIQFCTEDGQNCFDLPRNF